MTVGFVFDTILLKKGQDYFGMTLTYDFFQSRYLDKIDQMIIMTRCENIQNARGNIEGYKIVNGNRISVAPIFEYKKIPDVFSKKSKVVKSLEKKLVACDNVIIRMPSVLGILACDICRKNNIPYMIEMVACAWDGYMNHTHKIGKLIAPFMFYNCKKRIKNSDYVLYVTDEFLQKRYPTNGKSFSCSDVILNDDLDIMSKSKKFNPHCYKMCTIANVGMRYKGHIYAFKAIKKLKEKNVEIKYYLAGNGNSEYLKNKALNLGIVDNVIFLGSLQHEEVFKLLEDIDVYIQPSLQEGLPRALIEAMSKGCCCIGSDAGGITELLDKEYVFRRKNVNDLVKILESLTAEKVDLQGKRNLEFAKKFSPNILNKKRDNIYNNFFSDTKTSKKGR